VISAASEIWHAPSKPQPDCQNNPLPVGARAPAVPMMKPTEAREITPYRWMHPDEER
jgi:hypothetical protein